MFPFLAIFIIFCVLLTYYIRKNDNSQQQVEEAFWEKERQANAVRKKDISGLDYITIPLEKIPEPIHTPTEEQFFALAESKMLNLTGISNTDLKLEYGTANLDVLSEYDANFSNMVALLPEYTSELIEHGQSDTAQMLLEFAIDANCDSKKIYHQLSCLYLEKGESGKIAQLRESAEQLPPLTKKTVLQDLSTMH